MTDYYQNLSHTKWQCKYHVIFISMYRRKTLFGVVKQELGAVFHRLSDQKGCKIIVGHIMRDHVLMFTSLPPKSSVSSLVGYIKGKSAIQIARRFGGRHRNFTGENFWARGYFVSTVGLDEAMVRAYIRNQEIEDARFDQMKLGM